MFRALVLLACPTFTITLLANSAALDRATLAAMHLSDAPSYSWSAAVEDDARSYVKAGKHLRNSYTWVTLPMLDSLSRRLGRAAGTEIEAIFLSDQHCVIRVGERWKTVKQLPKAPPGYDDMNLVLLATAPAMRTADMPADVNASPGIAADPFPPVIVLTPPPRDTFEDADKPFSNARLAASPPHEELALIVSAWTNVVVDGDTVRGQVTDAGARLLLCPTADHESAPLAAVGEFTLHLQEKRVTRYQLKLEGALLVGKKKKILVRQSSDTTLRDIGSTRFEVPAEARLNLPRPPVAP